MQISKVKILNSLKYNSLSLIIHVLIALPLFFVSKNMVSNPQDTKEISKKLRVVGKAIRVDVVAMPQMTIQELKNVKEAAGDGVKPIVKKEAPKGGDENTVFKKEIKKPSFSDMLKNLSQRQVEKNKEKIKKKVVKKKGKAGPDRGRSFSDGQLKKVIALGNRISEGSSLYGGSGENSGDIFDRYAVSLMETVRKHWRLPGYLAKKDLKCKIQIFIGKNGEVLKHRVIESSGNPDYDDRALKSINAVGRFDAPAKEIASRIAAGEIALAFPL